MTLESKPAPRPAQKSLQHRTIAAAVADSLRHRILDGDFKAGFPLRQDALAGEFGVSRIPIREALMQLEAEGLVKIHPHRGAIVSELSTDEVQELFELRALLEPRLREADARHRLGERMNALRADTVVIGDQNQWHGTGDLTAWAPEPPGGLRASGCN